MFTDACPFLQQASSDGNFNVTRCRMFGGGVMLQGLTAASEEWQRMAYNVADRQLRGGFIRGRLQQGEGYMVDSDYFDYPSMQCNITRGCTLDRAVTIPVDGSALPPTHLPDEAYAGDYNASQVMSSHYRRYAIADEMRREQMDFVLEMDSRYLTPALFRLAQVYRQEAQDAINGYLSFISAFVPAYIVAFAGLVRATHSRHGHSRFHTPPPPTARVRSWCCTSCRRCTPPTATSG
jgi:hypothetical protein